MKREEILDTINSMLKKHLAGQRDQQLVRYLDPDQLLELLHLEDCNDGADWPRIFQWVQMYLDHSVKTGHPGFVNRMWGAANLPSIVGEFTAAVANTSACTFESAPVSTLMEKYMLQEMLDLAGFTNGEGQMTTGSSNANMLAMMAARNEILPEVQAEGLRQQPDMVGFVSADAHYSMEKAANILGLGTRRLIKIPVTHGGEMHVGMLVEKIEEALAEGKRPFFVGGTAGTTVRGAYDPIEKLLELRKRYGFWLHIDGAWGGAVVVSRKLRETYLAGIEEVDSFTWDFHKMLGTSLMSNVFLINNRIHTLGKVCSAGDDSYIFHGENSNAVLDLGAISLQCGRRVDSLKWLLDWKYFGRKGFAKRVEHCLSLCEYAEKIVHDSQELELVLPRSSFNLCFRYKVREERANQFNLALRTKLHHDGISLVGYAMHEGKLFLRLLLANAELTTEAIDRYFTNLIRTGKYLSGG
ncbi:MAG: PLP-dependent decarboxylase [Desulfobulbaceae bacterium]|nr:PLP-dependent decarboxylase [Desulfobulbaceae bacterium]